jgi:ribosomal protein S18 acetylase RimI-like enzyme
MHAEETLSSSLVDHVRTLVSRFRPRRITPTVPPYTIRDDCERDVDIRGYRAEDFEKLVGMYDDFAPEQRAQGVPPLTTEGIRDWLGEIVDGPNVVALCDERVVGHLSLVPDGTDRHELAIFVHQSYQQAGIGSALLAGGLGRASDLGVGYVWLSVGTDKRYQQRLYNRAGFSVVKPGGVTYRMSRKI